MFRQVIVAYVLGAFTFWPLVVSGVFFTFRYLTPQPEEADVEPSSDEPDSRQKKAKHYTLEHLAKLNSADAVRSVDFESDIEASGWIRLSPAFISATDPYEEAEGSQPKPPPSSARKSLRKLMSNSSFFSSFSSKHAKTSAATATTASPATPKTSDDINTAQSGTTGSGTAGSGASSVNADIIRPKSIAKCPRYWAIIRGAQLQLYEDETERKLMELITVPKFVVSLWPQNLQEYELFYRRYPITLISRVDSEGVVSLDLYPGIPPRDALYLYVSNPIEKEDLYFALIKASKVEVPSLSPITENLSLGPRDPVTMAKPVVVKKAEAQQLQSSIWNNELPQENQWLNALLGRIFLAIKDSRLADAYLRRKFALKLKPISDSSNIIGEIDVKQISSGSSAPYFSNIKLKELTPDGNLVLSAGISYNGGFKVILGTSVKLAAVTSLTTKEIPVELAATLRRLEGTVVIRVKPAPSERIWYSFETMPEVDLHIEPAVYETHISLSVVTKFIRGKILDSLKETLVMPYMDDLTFYDTSDSFYRGGIWEATHKNTPDLKKATKDKATKDKTTKDKTTKDKTAAKEYTPSLQSAFAPASPGLNPVSSPGADSVKSMPQTGRSSLDGSELPATPADTDLNASLLANLSTAGSGAASIASETLATRTGSPESGFDSPPPLAPRVRNRASSTRSSVDVLEPDTASQTARQRFSSWVRRRQANKDVSSSANSIAEPQDLSFADTESVMSRSPSSIRSMAWTSATTKVTPANASVEREPDSPSMSPVATRATEGPELSPKRRAVPKRKPVPTDTSRTEPATPATIRGYASIYDPSEASHATRLSTPSAFTDSTKSTTTNTNVDTTKNANVDINAGTNDARVDTSKDTTTDTNVDTNVGDGDENLVVNPTDLDKVANSLADSNNSGSDLDNVNTSDTSATTGPVLSESALGRLEFPNAPTAAPTAGILNESIKGELIEEPNRRDSITSKHSATGRHSRKVSDAQSVRSAHSGQSMGPALPPRNRRVVPLANIAPERDG